MELYTAGIWKIKPGKEQEFIKEWTSFAHWTSQNTMGVGKGHLLQDGQNPQRFISFGNWESEAVIEQWRGSKEFGEFMLKAKPLCEDFQPNTMRLVATSG